MTDKELLLKYTLRLADDALILGHRLSEWCSRGPILEEDLALTNLALDMIGRAQALLRYAAELEGKGRNEDDIAYRRPENGYFNHLLCELPNGDYAHTIVRQLFVSAYEYYLFEELQRSKNKMLSAIAAKTLKEVKYHLKHASDWVIRLGDGTPESHMRIQTAVNNLWAYTGELFEMDEVESKLLADGIAADLVPVKLQWLNRIHEVLKEATIDKPADGYMHTGGSLGRHTEYMGHILSEMQYLQRAYPDAKW